MNLIEKMLSPTEKLWWRSKVVYGCSKGLQFKRHQNYLVRKALK